VVIKAIDKLKSNPLYWASLGSRELFHSNFLGWLFEQYPSSAKAILNVDIDGFKVLREKHNIDLVLLNTDYLIAIENKFKDVPRAGQLRRYDDVLGTKEFCKKKYCSGNTERILLTLIPPSEIVKGWKTILYQDLIIRLQEWLDGNCKKKLGKHSIYIEDYIQFVSGIVEIFDQFKNKNDYWFSNNKKSKHWAHLTDIRFEDTITKLQANQFRMDVLQQLPPEIKNHSHFRSNAGLNNKSASVDFIFSTAKQGGPLSEQDVSLYIQIEGNTYRKAIEHRGWRFPKKRNDEYLCQRIESLEKEINLSFDIWLPKPPEEKRLIYDDTKSFTTSMQKNSNSYSPGFIYRYFNIEKDGGMPVNRLFEFINTDLVLAMELLESMEK